MRNLVLLTPRCYPVSKDLIPTGLRAYLLPKHLLPWGWRTLIITQWTGEEGGPPPCSIDEIPELLKSLPTDQIVVLPVQAQASLGRRLITWSRAAHQHAESSKGGIRSFWRGLGSSLSALALLSTGETHLTGGGWTLPAAQAAIRASEAMNIQAILATSHWDSALAARRTHRRTRIPWVQYFQDPWQMFTPRLARPIYSAYFHQQVLPSAAAICQCTPGWARELSRELRRMVTCIIGGHDAEYMASAEAKQFSHFNILFAGSAEIGTRDPKWVFEAISRLSQETPELSGDLEVLYIGWNQEIFQLRAAEAGVSGRLRCLGVLPPEQVIPYLKGAHLLLMMLDQTADYNLGRLSGKVGEYVGSGRPVLLLGQTDEGRETDLVRLIRYTGIGWVAQSADEVVVVLKRLLEQYHATGATTRPGGERYPTGDFSWQRQAQKLSLLLDRVVRGERDPIVEDLQVEYPWSRAD